MINSLVGRFLIATPSMADRRFKRSVILVCDHDETHAMGIVINRAMPRLMLPDLLDQLGIDCAIRVPAIPVLDGGPCQRDRGFVLHTDDWSSDETTSPIMGGLRMTATRDVLQAIAQGIKPSRATLALGYSGWDAGQLEAEIKDNAWLVTEGDIDAVFATANLDDKWEDAISRFGLEPWQISQNAGRA
jgi:putative transcriptional regulator